MIPIRPFLMRIQTVGTLLVGLCCHAHAVPLLSLADPDISISTGHFSYDAVQASYMTGSETGSVSGLTVDEGASAVGVEASISLSDHIFVRGSYITMDAEVEEFNPATGVFFSYDTASSYGDMFIGAHAPLLDRGVHLDGIVAIGGFRASTERDQSIYGVIPSLPFSGQFTFPAEGLNDSGWTAEAGIRTDLGIPRLDIRANYYYLNYRNSDRYMHGPRLEVGVDVYRGIQIGASAIGRSDAIGISAANISTAGGFVRYSF